MTMISCDNLIPNLNECSDWDTTMPKMVVKLEKEETKEQLLENYVEREKELARQQGGLINHEEYGKVLKKFLGGYTEPRLRQTSKNLEAMEKRRGEHQRQELIKMFCRAHKEMESDLKRKENLELVQRSLHIQKD